MLVWYLRRGRKKSPRFRATREDAAQGRAMSSFGTSRPHFCRCSGCAAARSRARAQSSRITCGIFTGFSLGRRKRKSRSGASAWSILSAPPVGPTPWGASTTKVSPYLESGLGWGSGSSGKTRSSGYIRAPKPGGWEKRAAYLQESPELWLNLFFGDRGKGGVGKKGNDTTQTWVSPCGVFLLYQSLLCQVFCPFFFFPKHLLNLILQLCVCQVYSIGAL